MNIIFQINGGIGKCVASTAVCEAIKKQYPESKLIIISGYPNVYLNNPNIYRSYNFGNINYFYEEYIENKDIKIFAHDPYLETNHIQNKEHLIKTWCNMFNIEYNGELPKVYLTEIEKTAFKDKFTSDKPILLLQTNGGVQNSIKYSWARDIPSNTVQKVIDYFKYDYNIVHLRREDQLKYENTFSVTDDFRVIVSLIEISHKRLLIDSFAQHTAAAINKPSTVCWIANSPNVFGYNIHNNILANPFTIKPELKNSMFNKFNIQGDLIEFPYLKEDDIFDIDTIIKTIQNN